MTGEELTIADFALFPWVRILGGFYEGGEVLGLDHVRRRWATTLRGWKPARLWRRG
jgi:glutathione S-transferase